MGGSWLKRAIGALTAMAALAGCVAPLRMANLPRPDAPGFAPTVASLSSSLMARGRTTGFWYRVDEIYAARLAAVRSAKRTVHFETYFMTPGKRADAFAQALMERARAGVRVCFIADAQGTLGMPRAYWKRLRVAGVEVRFYNPWDPLQPWRYNTRTHRKILTVDGEVALTGGTGVSDHWDGPPGGPWSDAEVRLEGPVVAAFEGVFAQHWTAVGGVADLGPEVFQPEEDHGVRMLVTPSGPQNLGSPLRTLYHMSLRAARQRIWIASPYFLPTRSESAALARARKRGLDVRVLSVGPVNDQPLTRLAVQEHACDLVAAGVKVLEYQPAMMHAKVMLIDDRWVVTGSANFDPRSFFHNDELTVASNDPRLAAFAAAYFEDAFARSKPLGAAELAGRDAWSTAQGRAIRAFWWFL